MKECRNRNVLLSGFYHDTNGQKLGKTVKVGPMTIPIFTPRVEEGKLEMLPYNFKWGRSNKRSLFVPSKTRAGQGFGILTKSFETPLYCTNRFPPIAWSKCAEEIGTIPQQEFCTKLGRL